MKMYKVALMAGIALTATVGAIAVPQVASANVNTCSASEMNALVWQTTAHNLVSYPASAYAPNSKPLRCQMQLWASNYGYAGTINGGDFSSGGSVWRGIQHGLILTGYMSSTATVDGVVDSQMVKAMQKAGNPGGDGVSHAIDGTLDERTWENFAYFLESVNN